MFEGLLLPWQQIYYLAFYSALISEQLLKFLVNFTLLECVKSQRSDGFLITKKLIFGFQILDLKVPALLNLLKRISSTIKYRES